MGVENTIPEIDDFSHILSQIPQEVLANNQDILQYIELLKRLESALSIETSVRTRFSLEHQIAACKENIQRRVKEVEREMLKGKTIIVPQQIDYRASLQELATPQLSISTYNLSPSIGRAVVVNNLSVGESQGRLGEMVVLEMVTFIEPDTEGKIYAHNTTVIRGNKPSSTILILKDWPELYTIAKRLLQAQQNKKTEAYYNK